MIFKKGKNKIHNRIFDELQSIGLEKIYNKIKKYVKEGINIKVTPNYDEYLEIGDSKIGGCPDLPINMEWPKFENKYMPFFAQLNFSQIKKYDKENLLPENGILYFFISHSDYVDYMCSDNCYKTYKTIVYSGDINNLERKIKPKSLKKGKDEYGIQGFLGTGKISFENIFTFPSPTSSIFEHLDFDNYLTEKEYDIYSELTNRDERNQILGYPFLVQNELWNEKTEDKDWVLLLQLSEVCELDLHWGDAGVNYIYIKKKDLKNKNFDNILYDFQCG